MNLPTYRLFGSWWLPDFSEANHHGNLRGPPHATPDKKQGPNKA